MDFIEFFSLWLGLSAAATFYATRLHRSGIVWLFVSLILSPVITFTVLFGLGPKDEAHPALPILFDDRGSGGASRPRDG